MAEVPMTKKTTEHLIRTLVREMQISATTFDQPDLMRFVTEELKQQVQEDAQRYHMTIIKIDIRTAPDFIIGDDGIMRQFYRVAAVAQGYMADESAQQAIRKIDIDNARHDWIDEDDC
jgi:hypothetical protein